MTTALCLRPEADFSRVDVLPPPSLSVRYHSPSDPEVPDLLRASAALVIPAVGPKLSPVLFEDKRLKLVQVTGAGIDRLDIGAMTRLGIPVANVPGRTRRHQRRAAPLSRQLNNEGESKSKEV